MDIYHKQFDTKQVVISLCRSATYVVHEHASLQTQQYVRLWCRMHIYHTDRVKRIWFLSHMRAAKVQASLRIRAVSPEPSLLA